MSKKCEHVGDHPSKFSCIDCDDTAEDCNCFDCDGVFCDQCNEIIWVSCEEVRQEYKGE